MTLLKCKVQKRAIYLIFINAISEFLFLYEILESMDTIMNQDVDLEQRIVAFDNLELLVEQFDNAKSKFVAFGVSLWSMISTKDENFF
jgi:hypothetical protein